MPIRVRVEIDGVSEVIGNIEEWGAGLETRIEEAVLDLSVDTETVWQAATPVRTGLLQRGDKADAEGMGFILQNPIRYYPWVDKPGHTVLKGWRVKTGIAGRFAGYPITETATKFVEANILERLGKAVAGE